MKETHRIAYLDGWRGLAILSVLAGHFCHIPGINLGTFGVELFFVLSGRLMADILFIQGFPLKQFYKRRLSRVYPALLAFVILLSIGAMGSSIAFGVKAIITALTFTFNYNIWIPGLYRTGALDHLWSLCIEEHCYLILGGIAFWARIYKGNPAPVIETLAILSMLDAALSFWVFHHDYFHTYWRTDAHLSSIFIAAALYLRRGGKFPMVSLMAGIILNLEIFPLPISYSFGTMFLAYAVCNLEQAPAIILRLFSGRFLGFVGAISYSLYLWQQPFYKLAETYNPALMLACVIGFSIWSFYIIERPSRKWLNENW